MVTSIRHSNFLAKITPFLAILYASRVFYPPPPFSVLLLLWNHNPNLPSSTHTPSRWVLFFTHLLIGNLIHFQALAYILGAWGGLLVIGAYYHLGIINTYLGDYVDPERFLMKAYVTGFPFNCTGSPMYTGASFMFLAHGLLFVGYAWLWMLYILVCRCNCIGRRAGLVFSLPFGPTHATKLLFSSKTLLQLVWGFQDSKWQELISLKYLWNWNIQILPSMWQMQWYSSSFLFLQILFSATWSFWPTSSSFPRNLRHRRREEGSQEGHEVFEEACYVCLGRIPIPINTGNNCTLLETPSPYPSPLKH